jgi:hypothetical protein
MRTQQVCLGLRNVLTFCQNRPAFAFLVRWNSERKPDRTPVLMSDFGIKFSGKVLLSATYGHGEA